MGLGRYTSWIAAAVLAAGAFAYTAQAANQMADGPAQAGTEHITWNNDAPAAHAGARGALPACENPDRAEKEWDALIGRTNLIPNGPTNTPTDAQVEAMQRFLLSDAYGGWCHDFSPRSDNIRMTGPFINDMAYGTHSRVTVFYSKGVIDWLQRGRRGVIPDGAAIIKVMYATPAYVPTGEKPPIAGYAVMVRAAKASHDGWLWLLYFVPENQSYHFEYLTSQYGASFCLSCHAMTASDDMTFADLGNLTGHDQVTYVEIGEKNHPADATHPAAPPPPPPTAFLRDQRTLLSSLIYQPLAFPLWEGNAEMESMLASRAPALSPPQITKWQTMPEDLIDDHLVPKPTASVQRTFAGSDACVGCHDASDLLNNVPPRMTIAIGAKIPVPHMPPRTRYNLTPYGEWSASLMSRSSRDPVFRAQYEAELAQVPAAARDQTAAFCMRCHGPMGAREVPELSTDPTAFYAWTDGNAPDPKLNRRAEYGALARDGVSCTVCHQIPAKNLGAPETWSGRFDINVKPGTIYGPYDHPLTRPMDKAIGMIPTKGEHITSSGLCASCHALAVPVYRKDDPKPVKTTYEQTTYLEWLNSDYADASRGKTCAACHMPAVTPPTFDATGVPVPGAPMTTQIANFEDASFPFVPNRAAPQDLQTEPRPNYARHTLVGLNTFTHAMFQQFPGELGAGSLNFGQALSLLPPSFLAARETLALADATVKLDVSPLRTTTTGAEVTVTVTNLAGHKFPSGVGFRRAWLEVKALDGAGQLLWCSGCSDVNGVMVDGAGKPLPSEFPTVAADLMPDLQLIDSQAKAQIYEVRDEDCNHALTDSFLRLCNVVKDNRLLPLGWKADGPYADDTRPIAAAGSTPGQNAVTYEIHVPGPGRIAHVQVRMLYQAMPPYYLVDRFHSLDPGAAPAPEASRLYTLVTHLNVDDPSLRSSGWRLEVTCADMDAAAGAPAAPCPRMR